MDIVNGMLILFLKLITFKKRFELFGTPDILKSTIPTIGELNVGRFIACTTGLFLIFGSGISMTSFCSGFSGSGGFSFECFEYVHPGILRNSVKSVHFFLQQVHPL